MMTFLSILTGILGLGFLIIVHEFGHFVVAKLTGMQVEEFSLGFGRYLVSKRVGETVYGISAVPLGGYVRVTGMHREEFEALASMRDAESVMAGKRVMTPEEIADTPLERRYYAHPLWHRLLFLIAGVGMNVIVAVLLLFVVGLQGYEVPTREISTVAVGSPAAAAGLQPGDLVLSVAGEPVADWDAVRAQILAHPGERVTVVVERDGTSREVPVTIEEREDGTGYMGVSPGAAHVEPGFLDAGSYAFTRTADIFVLIIKGIGMMFTGEAPVLGSEGLAGPLGIITISSEAVVGGYYLSLLAFISINLAILNMLPLLPLDGGHVAIALVEKVIRRRFSLRTFERASMVGFMLFVLLFLVATSNDLGRLFTGG